MNTNSLVFRREFLANFWCPIGRGIVRDDQFKIGVILLQDGIQSESEILFPVPYRETDTDFWNIHRPYRGMLPVMKQIVENGIRLSTSLSLALGGTCLAVALQDLPCDRPHI